MLIALHWVLRWGSCVTPTYVLIEEDDVVVLLGDEAAVAAAEIKLLQG